MTGRVDALVLAGGRSRRFGREKAMALLDGRPLIAWVAGALGGGGRRLTVSAPASSGAAAWARAHGVDVVEDEKGSALEGGPLAGVLAGLRWSAAAGGAALVTSPCDTPFLPDDLVERLEAAGPTRGACAWADGEAHPLCALWPVTALDLLQHLDAHPPVRRVQERLGMSPTAFEDAEVFRNINSPDDWPGASPRRPGRDLR